MAARRRAGSFSPKTSRRLRINKVEMLLPMASLHRIAAGFAHKTDPQLAIDWPPLRPIHNELSLSEQPPHVSFAGWQGCAQSEARLATEAELPFTISSSCAIASDRSSAGTGRDTSRTSRTSMPPFESNCTALD